MIIGYVVLKKIEVKRGLPTELVGFFGVQGLAIPQGSAALAT